MAASWPTSKKTFSQLSDGVTDMEGINVNVGYDEIEAVQTFICAPGAAQSHNATLLSLLADNYVGGRCYKKDADEIYVGKFAGIVPNAGGTIRKLRVSTSVTTLSAADLDTGTMAADTAYYIYATADTATTAPVFVISANASAPSGYTNYLRIGWFYNETVSVLDITSGFVSSFSGGGNVNKVFLQTGEVFTGSTAGPATDDSVPQKTEGDVHLTIYFIPTTATSRVKISLDAAHVSNSASGNTVVCLLQDDIANCLKARQIGYTGVGGFNQVFFDFTHTPGAALITYKMLIGSDGGGTTTLNGIGGARRFGAALMSRLSAEEK